MLFLVLLTLLSSPVEASKSGDFFSIQTGAFHHLRNAKKQFNLLKEKLEQEQLRFLRIERSGRLYIVRMGKFRNIREARSLLKKVKRVIKEGSIIKTRGAREIVELFSPEQSLLNERLTEINELISKGKLTKARGMIQEAFRQFGEIHSLYGLLGAVNLKESRYDEAFKNFSKAISLNDHVPEYFNGAGYALLFSNRPREALFDFERALKLRPRYSDALAGTAYAYLALGLKDDALNIYQKLKEINRRAASEVFRAILRTP